MKRAIGAALVGLPAVVDANVRVADVAQPGLHDRVCDGEDEVIRSQPKAFHVLKPIAGGMQCQVGLAGRVRDRGRPTAASAEPAVGSRTSSATLGSGVGCGRRERSSPSSNTRTTAIHTQKRAQPRRAVEGGPSGSCTRARAASVRASFFGEPLEPQVQAAVPPCTLAPSASERKVRRGRGQGRRRRPVRCRSLTPLIPIRGFQERESRAL